MDQSRPPSAHREHDSFAAAKAALARTRDGHLYDAAMRASGYNRDVAVAMKSWAVNTRTTRQPPRQLIVWDSSFGTSRTVIQRAVPLAAFRGRLTFHSGDMISAADALSRSAPTGKTVAVLNMANANHPGGGFLSGARAQEEQLCHRSDLFLRLRVAQADNQYPIWAGTALVTPNVALLRGGPPAFDLLPNPQNKVGVVSVAAKQYRSEEQALADVRLETNLEDSWLAVINGGREIGASVLVVSALGAGAFHNPPDVVGRALVTALNACDLGDRLTHIAVVVLDDHNSNDNVERMRKAMHSAAVTTGLLQNLAAFDGFGDDGPLPVPTSSLGRTLPAAAAAVPPPSTGPSQLPAPPPPRPTSAYAPAPPSQEARRLLAAQQAILASVERHLASVPAAQYRKGGHWAWYVFPTTKVGSADTQWRTAVKGPDDVAFLMRHVASVAVWSSILERLVAVLRAQGARGALPSVDHGRVDFFLREWSAPAYRAATAGAPRFVAAFDAFKAAWERA